MKLIEGSELGGHYKIIKCLGEGAYGAVYRAQDLNLHRELALKVLKPGAVASEADLKRVKRECIILAKLDHPNIVRIYSFEFLDEEVPVIAMEYVPGETLARKIATTNKPFDYQTCKSILRQICLGLSQAHREGIIHRDLSALNVLLAMEQGNLQVKLIDFGLSKLLAPDLERSGGKDLSTMALTKTQNLVGNPFYMSPEACRGEKLDVKTDIYSLGCVLYEMMSGRKLFDSADPLSVLYMQQSQYPLPPNVPWDKTQRQEILQLLWNCLQKEKEKRPDSVDAIISFLDGTGSLPVLQANRQWAAALGTKSNRALTLAGLLGLALVFCVLAVGTMQKTPLKKDSFTSVEKTKYGKFIGIKSIERQIRNLEAKQRLFGRGSKQMIGPLRSLGTAYRDAQFAEESRECLDAAYQIALREKDYEQCIAILADLVRDAPPSRREKYAKEGLEILEKLGKQDSGNYHEFLGQIAISYRLQGKLKEAAQLQLERLKMSGDRSDIFYELGLVYAAQGKQEQAASALKKSIDMCANQGQKFLEGFGVKQLAMLALADIYFKQGKFEQAENLYLAIKELFDSSSVDGNRKLMDTSVALSGIGRCEMSRGHASRAVESFAESVKCMDRANFQSSATYWIVYNDLAKAYAQAGKTADAEAKFKKVMTMAPPADPIYTEARDALAKLYKNTGQPHKAPELR